MNEKQILDTLETLACSQGFYGRLLDSINSLEYEDYRDLMNELEKQNFKDALDIVMYFEC